MQVYFLYIEVKFLYWETKWRKQIYLYENCDYKNVHQIAYFAIKKKVISKFIKIIVFLFQNP